MDKEQTGQKGRGVQLLLILLVIVIGVVLYWPTLRLPLFYDDLLHIRITKGLDFASVWLPTDDFGFYRPLTFLPLLLIKAVFGSYPSELLHGINVLQHAFNAALLVALSWRLWRRIHWALAAGLLFVFFPFSYQAVSVYGHNVHPATTGLLLAGLHTYLSGIRAQERAFLWWAATIVFFVLGLLSHESAILFGALAAMIHWNDRGQLPRIDLGQPRALIRQIARWPWFSFLIGGAIYAIGYLFLDISRAPQASLGSSSLWYKALYLGQGAAYPITWIGRWFPKTEPAAIAIVLLGLGLMIGLTIWSGRKKDNRLPLLLGWGWWALASLLVALPLETGYFLHGPRLLYLSSAGLALLWPVLLEPIYKLKKIGWLLWGVILIVILVSNGSYIRDRLVDYRQLTSPVALIEERLQDRSIGEGVAIVNLPQWIDRLDNPYQVGVDLVAIMGDYLFIDELIRENIEGDRPARAFLAPELLAAYEGYNYGVHEQNYGDSLVGSWAPDGSNVFITSYTEDGIGARYAGTITPAGDTGTPIASFGPYELLEISAQSCDEQATVSTTWRLTQVEVQDQAVPPTTSLFVQLLDKDGQIIDQADGPLLSLSPDFLNLDSEWIVVDNRELQTQEGRSGQLMIGVYDYANGIRYGASDQQGKSLADDALRIPLKECK